MRDLRRLVMMVGCRGGGGALVSGSLSRSSACGGVRWADGVAVARGPGEGRSVVEHHLRRLRRTGRRGDAAIPGWSTTGAPQTPPNSSPHVGKAARLGVPMLPADRFTGLWYAHDAGDVTGWRGSSGRPGGEARRWREMSARSHQILRDHHAVARAGRGDAPVPPGVSFQPAARLLGGVGWWLGGMA